MSPGRPKAKQHRVHCISSDSTCEKDRHTSTHAAMMGSVCLMPVTLADMDESSCAGFFSCFLADEGALSLRLVLKPPRWRPGTTLPLLLSTPFVLLLDEATGTSSIDPPAVPPE